MPRDGRCAREWVTKGAGHTGVMVGDMRNVNDRLAKLLLVWLPPVVISDLF